MGAFNNLAIPLAATLTPTSSGPIIPDGQIMTTGYPSPCSLRATISPSALDFAYSSIGDGLIGHSSVYNPPGGGCKTLWEDT